MPYRLPPSKPGKPQPWTPDGKQYTPAPVIDLTKVRLDGGFAKWSGTTELNLDIVIGTTIVPFVAVEHMAEPMSFTERMQKLIAFFKDNEGELVDVAERADAEQAKHAEAMEVYLEKTKPKKR